jgi:glycosyltransferase involved in cell wall biosynthesis
MKSGYLPLHASDRRTGEMLDPSVSVIIPTVDRPAVRRAVASALNQTCPPLEIIVVVDSADHSIPPALRDVSDKIRLFFAGGIGPGGARTLGAAEAEGDIIAFLDDDDEWLPEKLERQLAIWPTGPEINAHTVVSSRLTLVDHHGRNIRTLPPRLISAHERMPSYLFCRPSLAVSEGGLHPSTIMCDRALIDAEPWEASLFLHEDWDWLLRIGRRSDVTVLMCPEALVRIAVADERSLSRSVDWRESLEWFEQRADQMTPRERGDFLMYITAAIASRAGSRRGGFTAARRALHYSRPNHTAWIIWGIHMLSPRLVDYVLALHDKVMQGKTLRISKAA